jgi:catechol 2,3-dioxygenase-like lactoylglutathione lyase family enzyme
MKLDGFGVFVKDMATMIRFYRDVLRFEITESKDTSNVYLEKDGTLFLFYGRPDFEKMTGRSFRPSEAPAFWQAPLCERGMLLLLYQSVRLLLILRNSPW